MELFASDLHINQILVDNSAGAMDLKWEGAVPGQGLQEREREREIYIYISLTSASSPGFPSQVPSLPTPVLPSLLSCQLVH